MGLLDNMPGLDTAQGQGLLAAAFSMMGAKGKGLGNAIGEAGRTYMGATTQAQNGMDERAYRQMQVDGYKRKQAQEQAQLQEQQRIRDLMSRAGSDGNPIDYPDLIRRGVPYEQVKALADSRNFGRDKVARTAEVEGPNGSKMIQSFDDYGGMVGQGVNGYVAPQLINQGNKQVFAKPQAGASFPMGMSPSESDASERGWANVRQTAARLDFDKSGGPEGVKPQYRDGQWVTPPSNMQPGQAVPAMASTVQKDAREALELIKTAKELIPKSTGSYLGAGVDQAARVFGASTGGDTAAAQLKALEGALVSKMPKMSGPQSDKDVLLYKQMAGEIGDPTIPGKRKLAALQVIEQIQNRHSGSGATGAWDTPAKPKAPDGWSIEQVK